MDRAPRVFISYSHDSEQHRERVLALSERLRLDGIETILDRYVNGSPSEGWPRWMLDGLDAANRVLLICTPTYYRRFRGHEEPGKGKGVDWEGAIITLELYHARSRTKDRTLRDLLTRAWFRHAFGDHDAARSGLDEAQRIAARGGMALHLADIALYRARLFHDRTALAEARRLIETCNYGRRRQELKDAEVAAMAWPETVKPAADGH